MLYGVSAMQGWRISMEDAHITILNLLKPDSDAAKAHSRLSFFGVFDGHGGDKVALYAGENIDDILVKQDTFKAGNYEQALKDCFLATDRAILSGMSQQEALKNALGNKLRLTSDRRSQVRRRGLRLYRMCGPHYR